MMKVFPSHTQLSAIFTHDVDRLRVRGGSTASFPHLFSTSSAELGNHVLGDYSPQLRGCFDMSRIARQCIFLA